MRVFRQRAIGCVILAAVVMVAMGLASCSSNHANGAGDDRPGDSAAKATLDITASLDGRDVTSDSGGMVADSHRNFAGNLKSGSDGLEATLAPGKYKVLVTYQGDGYDGALPMQVLDVEIKAGQTTRKNITLDKNVSMAALQMLQQMSLQAVQAAAGRNTGSGGTPSEASFGASRHADPARLVAFATCAGLPQDYFGDVDDIPSEQLNTEPGLVLPTVPAVAIPTPPRATPMQAAFDTMWARNVEAAAIADAVEATMSGLRAAIVWGDMDRAGKHVEHLSKLRSRMAAADRASRLAEAKLLRFAVAPLLRKNPPPMFNVDDPVAMQRAFIAWQQKLKQDGLPPQTVAMLKRSGWTDQDIAAVTANAIRAPAGQVVPQTIVGAVMVAATIRHDEQGNGKQVAAANAELDKLQRGVTRCGSL
jgi:predicted small secreted protein